MVMNNEPVAYFRKNYDGDWVEAEAGYEDESIPLYTHPAQELNAGGEPVKNATYWKRQHDGLLMKLNTSAIKISELEKDLKYFTDPCNPLCKPSICDCYQARFAINNRKTLTDEEILNICIKFGFYDRISDPHFDDKTGAWSLDEDLIQFARAILRKAQEK
jgi:hypothetical protein